MIKVVENGERICTVALDGSESSVVFQNDYKYFAVKNESDAAVYVSLNRDIVEGADGVMKIGSKESILFPCMKPNVNMFFVKGTGKIQVCASSIPVNPFNSAPAENGGGVIKSKVFTGTTDKNSLIVTDLSIAKTKIINVLCLSYALLSGAFTLDDTDKWGLMFYDVARRTTDVQNRDVSLIIYYIEDSTNI